MSRVKHSTTEPLHSRNIWYKLHCYMGLATKNPAFEVCQQQKLKPACASRQSPLFFTYWKVSYQNLIKAKFQLFYLVSVAEQVVLSMTWLETLKTGLVALKPWHDKSNSKTSHTEAGPERLRSALVVNDAMFLYSRF